MHSNTVIAIVITIAYCIGGEERDLQTSEAAFVVGIVNVLSGLQIRGKVIGSGSDPHEKFGSGSESSVSHFESDTKRLLM